MNLRKIFVYASAGEEARGSSGSGFVGTVIECFGELSLNPLREYSSLLRKRIEEEKINEVISHKLYKGVG